MYLIKASGKKEKFKPEKIIRTAIKAGASRKFAKKITNKVKKKVYNGITTKEILKLTLELLKEKPEIASRYDLKRAIMNLGPSGFPFEKFFAELLRNYGYETKVGIILQGKNIEHEIDIIAKKEFNYMIECKYHNLLGNHTNVKAALYTYARFLDLKNKNKFDYPWLATNTKCSLDAIDYAKGVDMRITTWNYPGNENLQKLIKKKKLYPITILKSVKGYIKERLSYLNITLARQIVDEFEFIKEKTGFSKNTLEKIREEAYKVCFVENKKR